MKNFIPIIFFIILGHLSMAQQNIKTYCLDNIQTINSIDPIDTNFSDLEIIGNAIGNSKIVMLGEQDHGDAPTFLAKTRIIKYLHEKLNFDVLVFESDFWGLNEIWDNSSQNNFSIDTLRKNTYTVWAECDQAQDIYEYINKCYYSDNPLIVSGMDCRHALPYSRKNIVIQFNKNVIQESKLINDTANHKRFIVILQNLIDNEYKSKVEIGDSIFFFTTLDSLENQFPQSDLFWKQEIQNIRSCAINALSNFKLNISVRDEQMAENLEWICKVKYPDKKIIVWAANFHIAKNLNNVSNKTLIEYTATTGNETYKTFKDSLYILGFTSFKGTAGRITMTRYKIKKPKGECFENWVNTKNINYGFINFRNYNKDKGFYMKGLGHTEINANWTKIFDGIFYIKEMEPCDKVK